MYIWSLKENDDVFSEKFHHLDKALRTFDFDDSEIMDIYKTIAGILFWNMIDFEEHPHLNSGCLIGESSMHAVERAAELFGLDRTEIEKALTKYTICVQSEYIE